VITAIDTNILIDILEPDPVFGPASRDQLKRCRREGKIVACEVVWAEVAASNSLALEDLHAALDRIGLEFSALSYQGALEAAKSWRAYRRGILKRDRIAADFLIGGHARVQCDRLLTRDRGFYREYFDGLQVVNPSNGSR
jgi:predicted nucleic acid-binding protein